MNSLAYRKKINRPGQCCFSGGPKRRDIVPFSQVEKIEFDKMVRDLITLDYTKSPREQSHVLHNRYHPEIPAVASVKQGEIFKVQCVDWTGKLQDLKKMI